MVVVGTVDAVVVVVAIVVFVDGTPPLPTILLLTPPLLGGVAETGV
jgi:hypothetical protein